MVREWSIERDDRLIKELYPDNAKKVMPFIEAECDRMEYNGSRMYDEFPDKHMMNELSERIYENVRRQMDEQQAYEDGAAGKRPEEIYADDDIFATSFKPDARQIKEDSSFKDLIQVLMYHEMFCRRCSHNQCKCCRR